MCRFDDRIEIISPGGPFGSVTPENFGQHGVVDYRNPYLAETMRTFGLVRRHGLGLPVARRDLRRHGRPEPTFRMDTDQVTCVLTIA